MRMVLGLMGLLASGAVAAQKLVPLQNADVMPGCGCRFVVDGDKAPTMHWSWVGAKQAVVRDDKKAYWLDMQTEKYIPEKRQPAKYGDRMVLFFADGDWRVQVVGTVENGCAPKIKSCSGAQYKVRLIVQSGAGRREELPATGICGC